MKQAFSQKTLDSGLRTIMIPRTEVQSVTFLVLIGVGSRYETPRRNGLSHFLEHMFFKGTKARPTAKEIAEALDRVGGEYNAFTGEEYTGYYVKLAKHHLAYGAEVVSDILLHPLFPEEEIERERGVIAEEIRMYTESPMRHVHHLWQEALFGKHPLGRRIDGSIDTISAFKRSDFLSYTRQHYHTGNAVVCVAGNVQTSATRKLLESLFEALPQGDETMPKPAPSRLPRQRFVHESRKHLDQTHVMVGVPGLARDDERRYAATLLGVMLGGGMSSRLFYRVREREGLAYMVRTGSEEYTDTGSFVTQAGVRTDKADRAVRIILEEYDRIMTDGVSDEELGKAKEMIKGHLVLQLEETNALAMFAGEQELLSGKVRTQKQIIQAIEKVTCDDVVSIAQYLLDSKKRAIALLSPHTSTRSFEKLVE